jgi:hypothetical protein
VAEGVRAQAEALGYVIVVALIISATVVVYVGASTGLRDVRDAERTNNAEVAAGLLADAGTELVSREAPSRAVEVSLADSEVYLDDQIRINVTGQAVNSKANFSNVYRVTPIVYTAGDDRFVYEGGVLFRVGRGGTLVRHAPPMSADENRTVVSVLQTRTRARGVGGDGTVLVRLTRADTGLIAYEEEPYDLNVTVYSPRAAGWERALEDQGFSCTLKNAGMVSCYATSDRVAVSVVRVDVAFEN